jgi:hypothetical protein
MDLNANYKAIIPPGMPLARPHVHVSMSAPCILLINPWIHDFAAYDLWVKPLGLLTIGGVLRRMGAGVHLIDCLDGDADDDPGARAPSRADSGRGAFRKTPIAAPEVLRGIPRRYSRYGMSVAAFAQALQACPRPDCILVTSMMTYWYTGVRETIAQLRQRLPGVPVLLGGIYATLCPEHARRVSGADQVVAGSSLPRLIALIAGVTGWNPSGRPREEFPLPDCSLLSSRRVLPLITSRGCPCRCSYCASRLLQPGFAQRTSRSVVDEIVRHTAEDCTTDFAFYDDALLVNAPQHIIPVLRELVRRDIRVRLHVPNGLHIRGITPELAALMRRSGFATLRLGLETIDPELQQATGAKVAAQEFVRAAGYLRDAGFSAADTGVYILAGLPGQRHDSVRRTVMAVREQLLRPHIAEYSPIPGTSLWRDALACSAYPLAEEPLFHNNTLLPCRWQHFSLEHLADIKRLARLPLAGGTA